MAQPLRVVGFLLQLVRPGPTPSSRGPADWLSGAAAAAFWLMPAGFPISMYRATAATGSSTPSTAMVFFGARSVLTASSPRRGVFEHAPLQFGAGLRVVCLARACLRPRPGRAWRAGREDRGVELAMRQTARRSVLRKNGRSSSTSTSATATAAPIRNPVIFLLPAAAPRRGWLHLRTDGLHRPPRGCAGAGRPAARRRRRSSARTGRPTAGRSRA